MGMMDKFVGMKFFSMKNFGCEKFCWVCDVGA